MMSMEGFIKKALICGLYDFKTDYLRIDTIYMGLHDSFEQKVCSSQKVLYCTCICHGLASLWLRCHLNTNAKSIVDIDDIIATLLEYLADMIDF